MTTWHPLGSPSSSFPEHHDRQAPHSWSIEPAVEVDHYLAAVDGGARCGPQRRTHQGRDRPADSRAVRRTDRRPRRPATPAGQLRLELPVLDRRVHRCLARAARRGRRRRGPVPSAGRHRPANRRRRQRRPDRRRADRQHEEPDRASRRHRRRARHAAAVGELPRLGAGAVDRHRGQRAAPRHPDGGAPVPARSERDRAGPGALADPGARRTSA